MRLRVANRHVYQAILRGASTRSKPKEPFRQATAAGWLASHQLALVVGQSILLQGPARTLATHSIQVPLHKGRLTFLDLTHIAEGALYWAATYPSSAQKTHCQSSSGTGLRHTLLVLSSFVSTSSASSHCARRNPFLYLPDIAFCTWSIWVSMQLDLIATNISQNTSSLLKVSPPFLVTFADLTRFEVRAPAARHHTQITRSPAASRV